MMPGKSQQSEIILEIIKFNNSFSFFKEFGKVDDFIFCQNLILLYFFTFILTKRAKLSNISLFISITLKFAILTHHCNLRSKFYNEIFKSFSRIHNLKSVFKIVISRNLSMFSSTYFVRILKSILYYSPKRTKISLLSLLFFSNILFKLTDCNNSV